MTPLDLLVFIALGAAAGTFAGLLGVGGGVIVVPGLAFVLADGPVPAERLMQIAVGTALATQVATALSSIRAHHRRRAVRWRVVARLAPGLVVGAAIGAAIAAALPTRGLAIVFGTFLLLMAVRLAVPWRPAVHRQVPSSAWLGGWGVGMGTIASLLGIGGGAMTVPLLTWSNVPLREAVGTAAACGLPIAAAGAAAFAVAGWGTPGLPAWTTGYVYWPAFVALAPTTVLCAPLGARLAHAVPVRLLRRGFAVFLGIVGVRMLID